MHPPKSIEKLYDEVGEYDLFQLNDGSCAQSLHSVECKHKMIDEESHVKT